MNYLFILQTEGRGHLTQSVALADMLATRGHQITEIWAGGNPFKRVPQFISDPLPVRIRRFPSPGFISTANRKGIMPLLSVMLNMLLSPVYLVSVVWMAFRIRCSGADTIVNFYELTGGLAYRFAFSRKKYVVLSHHFFFEHPSFLWPKGHSLQQGLLKLHNRVCSPGSGTALALSFTPEADTPKLKVVPPLIRKEFYHSKPEERGHLHIYLLKKGFLNDIKDFCRRNPEIEVNLFTGNIAVRRRFLPQNLKLYKPDGNRFRESLRTASWVLSTAGFETVCESALLGKRILLLPVKNHYEQFCNAADASRAGLAVTIENLDDLQLLLRSGSGTPATFKAWLDKSEERLVKILE
jgi:uncharacterized protein (TIGR00661 family)